MFNFNKIQEQRLDGKKGKFIRPGVQTLILKDIFLEVSQNTGKSRPVFFMETEPVTDAGWEGHEGAIGQIGKIASNGGYYLKDDRQQEEFISFLRSIMSSVGRFDEFMEKYNETDFNNLQEVIDAVKPYLVGSTARYFVAGEQYQKLDKSGIGLKLKFPNRKVVESLTVAESQLPKYDETNPVHFKRLQKPTEPEAVPADDLPF